MKLVVVVALALTAVSATAACSKPAVKARPTPVYIAVDKAGKITFSDNVPPELRAEIESSHKVNP